MILHLICGLPGSGKTTLAKQLEHDLPALSLCPDEWMARIVGDAFDDQKRAASRPCNGKSPRELSSSAST